MVEVPEPGATCYAPQDVPHGQVREVWYHSAVTETWRHALAYTPPDYDTQTKVRSPVRYLQYGASEDETGWTKQGHANLILDNLIASGSCKPMIVVMANGAAERGGEPPLDIGIIPISTPEWLRVLQEMMGPFEEDATQALIPFIDC